MARLLIIRHGETDWNRGRRLQGHKDVPLNRLGHEQARQLASDVELEFQSRERPLLFTSDLRRARQTAEIVGEALGCRLRHTPALRERHLGIAEGKTWDELLRELPDEVTLYRSGQDRDALPGSEASHVFRERVLRGILKVASQADREQVPALVITHGGVLKVLLEETVGLGKHFSIGNATLYRFDVSGGRIQRVREASSRVL